MFSLIPSDCYQAVEIKPLHFSWWSRFSRLSVDSYILSFLLFLIRPCFICDHTMLGYVYAVCMVCFDRVLSVSRTKCPTHQSVNYLTGKCYLYSIVYVCERERKPISLLYMLA